MRKLKKPLFIFFGCTIAVIALVILFISPITKYLVEKYDEKYTGRQITMGWAYVNPFTGYIHFSNLKIYESKSDSVFFSTDGISADIAMLKLFFKTYEISKLTINHPLGIIIQDKKVFNFNDLVEKLISKENSDTTKAIVHFNILDAEINDGEFRYRENDTPVNYFIKNVHFETTGKRWDADTVAGKFSFLSGTGGGNMKGEFTINLKTNEYRLAVVIHKFDLQIIDQYLEELTNYGTFSANLDADINATGNFNDKEDITATGALAINDFHFGKNTQEDYVSFNKLALGIIELAPKDKKYIFDSVSLIHPMIKYEQYEHLDNMQMMFGEAGANIRAAAEDPAKFNLIIEIARYVKIMVRNFFSSYYKINKLAIDSADLKYNDYSLNEKFAIAANPFTVKADSIDKNHNRVEVSLKSGIKPYGNFSVALGINPHDSADFDMNYLFQKLPVAMFNPYLVTYTSFPLDRGTIELKGTWTVRKGEIQSVNHLVVIDPRVTKRIKNKNTNWVPMPLVMSFVREYGNVIDYEIPITGNLKNPNFHLHDVLMDIIGNIFIKPVTTPYRMEIRDLETEIEKSLTFKWQMRQSALQPEQEKFVEHIVDFLKKNQEASIAVSPQQYALKEKEYILFFEAKKKYYSLTNNKNPQYLTEGDSEKVDKMSIQDSLFIHYLNKQVNDSTVFTIQDKCSRLIDPAIVNSKFKKLNKEREDAFMVYFKKSGVAERVKISAGENVIPYNGFSFYKIAYNGELPEDLTRAYHKIQGLNDEAPRKKYEREHKENKSVLSLKTGKN